ncbi:DNA invertase Pin-like site-specific DNA recombinase [Staphylococcus epidermidis]
MDKIFFTMMSAFAELKANLLSERTKKGLDATRARERKGGDLHYLTIRREKLNSYMMNKN